MEYLCILNAFEQNYYNRIKEIERITGTASTQTTTTTVAEAADTICNHLPTSQAATTTTSAISTHNVTPQATFADALATPTTTSTSTKKKKLQICSGSLPNMPNFAAAAAIAATQQHLQKLQQQQQHNNDNMQFHHHHHHHQQQQQHQHQQFPVAQRQTTTTAQDIAAFQQHNNSSVVNSLLWQPWRDLQQAAAIHQQLCQQHQQLRQESRVSSKELPTIKWRRERRQRTAEYQHVHDVAASTYLKHEADNSSMDSPIDMSVTSSTARYQLSPPPYREPLPGSSCYVPTTTTRPSVITQAPPKRDPQDSISSISSRETENQSTESISMCETVIDEHFRRSLGADYAVLFGKKSPTSHSSSTTPSPQPSLVIPTFAATPPSAHSSILQSSGGGQAYSGTSIQPEAAHSALPLICTKSARILQTHGVAQHKTEPLSSVPELPPPQEEPLSLHRESTPPPPIAQRIQSTPPPPYTNELTKSKLETSQTTLSSSVSPPPPPPTTHLVQSARSTPTTTTIIPVIKAEPALSEGANTPPASPTSTSAGPILVNPDVLASVDDHFAKALGDTWKKLQENKDLQK